MVTRTRLNVTLYVRCLSCLVPVTPRTGLSEDRKSTQLVRYRNGRGEKEGRDGNKSTKTDRKKQVNKTITNLHGKKKTIEQRM